MIGILSKARQARVVEEFFELFKTPWEFYRPERTYDVIIVTTDTVPEVHPKLLVVYGPCTKDIDSRFGFEAGERNQGAVLTAADHILPVYGEALMFAAGARGNEQEAIPNPGGVSALTPQGAIIRLGYDLFDEVELLLTSGQPIEYAHVPTLDLHIMLLRKWIVQAGVAFVEIPPTPANHSFVVCLTHDIDFIGIRNHRFDHSMWGFVFRGTVGTLLRYFKGRLSFSNLVRSWMAVASLPLVYAGWIRDLWEPFQWYMAVENGLPTTYFLIPFKGRPGERVPGAYPSRRAAAYDVREHAGQVATLINRGCEVGLHGIDAWIRPDSGRGERTAISDTTGRSIPGVRMHWLLRDVSSPFVLEQAGFTYDSSAGYNETVGYQAGTSQVFRPPTCEKLLELPLHIQDGALFYSRRLDLSEDQAEQRCASMIAHAIKLGGAVTVLWHDRSHAPERFWGGFYQDLISRLRSSGCWFGTAGQVVGWFQKRRDVRFGACDSGVRLHYEGEPITPALRIRVHSPGSTCSRAGGNQSSGGFTDIYWTGDSNQRVNTEISSLMLCTHDNSAGACLV